MIIILLLKYHICILKVFSKSRFARESSKHSVLRIYDQDLESRINIMYKCIKTIQIVVSICVPGVAAIYRRCVVCCVNHQRSNNLREIFHIRNYNKVDARFWHLMHNQIY